MNNKTRGRAIKARRLAHGIKSVRAFAEASGLSREAVTAAEADEASDATYDRLEAWLESFEEEAGIGVPYGELPEDDPKIVTFRLSGNFGVDVVVSGPVSDIDKLEATVDRLIRGMGRVGAD